MIISTNFEHKFPTYVINFVLTTGNVSIVGQVEMKFNYIFLKYRIKLNRFKDFRYILRTHVSTIVWRCMLCFLNI